MTELRVPPEEWQTILPLVQLVLNSAPHPSLQRLSAMELCFGVSPTRPINFLFQKGRIKPVSRNIEETVRRHVERFVHDREEIMKDLHKTVVEERAKLRSHNVKHLVRRGAKFLDADIGDFVLLAGNRRGKYEPRWIGPFLVIGTPHPHIRKIRDLVSVWTP